MQPWPALPLPVVDGQRLFEYELRKIMKLEITSKYPVQTQHPTPLLFIHGMMHGAWCWDVHFLDYFVQHARSEIIPDVAHNSMLEPGWQAVADRIQVWLKERKV